MKVRRRVLTPEHEDHNPEEPTDYWHVSIP
jgi:hypothetical protein